MTCVPAPSCKAALNEASGLWPSRSRASDGICASPQHHKQNPTSDHERGNAFDLTDDPAHGVDCGVLAEIVIHDPRVKYVIFRRRIYTPAVDRSWRPYHGDNPHTKHMHVSIHASARDSTGPWFVPHHPTPPEDDMPWTDEDSTNLAEVKNLLEQMNHHISGAPDKGARFPRLLQMVEKIAGKP